ncbi:hypothetical protein [Scytonema sp. PCC 10023]|uniref:hypothetical protein n=1 Tax=Scytonema sp. PCC 10023 TaxID=1680591 RepID=UPI0039C739F6
MSNEFLTKQDLLFLTKKTVELVNKSTNQRIKLLDLDIIDNNQNTFISNEEAKLLNEANRAANLAIKTITTDLKNSEASKVLQKTIIDLQEVIEQLEKFNIFIGIFAKLITVFSRINQVIAAGGGAVVVISSLVDELIKLSNSVGERGGGNNEDYVPGTI